MTDLMPCKCRLCGQYPNSDAFYAQCWGTKEHTHELIYLPRKTWDAVMNPTPARLEGARIAIEAAAEIIEKNTISDNSITGRSLRPRIHGSIDGLAYAAAIRAIDLTALMEKKND